MRCINDRFSVDNFRCAGREMASASAASDDDRDQIRLESDAITVAPRRRAIKYHVPIAGFVSMRLDRRAEVGRRNGKLLNGMLWWA